jgi:mRNA-degrading endonuclease toxin of MazEF toxin-antitoxin module
MLRVRTSLSPLHKFRAIKTTLRYHLHSRPILTSMVFRGPQESPLYILSFLYLIHVYTISAMYASATMDSEQTSEKSNLFDDWNEKKQILDSNKRELIFKEGQIWWCSLGINVGEEVYGKGSKFSRPVIIMKKLSGNQCIIVPLTSKPHSGSWYYPLSFSTQNRWAMLHQIRSISANRLLEYKDSPTKEEFEKIKKSLTFLLGLS